MYASTSVEKRGAPRPADREAPRWKLEAGSCRSDVQILHVLRILLDELPARLDVVAHQRREDLVGFDRVLERHLEDRARLGIHGRLPELVRIHLAQTLVALD